MEGRIQVVSATVKAVVVSLALACQGLWVFGASAPALLGPVLKQLMLADFEATGRESGAPAHGEAWYDSPRYPGNTIQLWLDSTEKDSMHGHCLQLSYTFATPKAAEMGFRLDLHGLDASDYDHLTFWVKGDRLRGYARSFKVEFRRPDPEVKGLMEKGSFVVSDITDKWQQVVVPLNFMTGIRQWTNLREFIISFHSRRSVITPGAYCIDRIALIKTGKPGPNIWDPVASPKKQAWEAALGGREAAKPYLQARLVGWPHYALVDKKTLPQTDREFLWRLAHDIWHGLEALSDREHGLPLDHVHFGHGSVALSSSYIGDYTNVATIGLYLIAVVAARELQFITEHQALTKLHTTLTTLERLETYQGFFYNYYDTTTLERTSNLISFVDSSWLTVGLMVVRMSFPELYRRCTRLIEQGNYRFFYDDVTQHMSHGYYVNLPTASEYHYGTLYTESRLGSLIAMGKGEVPVEHWFRMVRTFPAEYSWQSQKPRARRLKTIHGYELTGGYYHWKGLNYVPSWGGSMFEALMPTLVLDEQRYAPRSLGENGKRHAVIQCRYALEELGYPVWGMSPSSTPQSGGYAERGVKVLGSRGYESGVVTPHAVALALSVTPKPAIANLRRLTKLYNIYGQYGFYDAVEPLSGKVAYQYLALNQAMILIAVANYLNDHCIQRRFTSDPIARRVLPILGEEDFFD